MFSCRHYRPSDLVKVSRSSPFSPRTCFGGSYEIISTIQSDSLWDLWLRPPPPTAYSLVELQGKWNRLAIWHTIRDNLGPGLSGSLFPQEFAKNVPTKLIAQYEHNKYLSWGLPRTATPRANLVGLDRSVMSLSSFLSTGEVLHPDWIVLSPFQVHIVVRSLLLRLYIKLRVPTVCHTKSKHLSWLHR